VASDFRPDLDQLLAQRRQRPRPHRPGQRQLAQEVPQVVGQGEQLEPRLVVPEPAARQPRPLHRILALLSFPGPFAMEISEEWETEKVYLRMEDSGSISREE